MNVFDVIIIGAGAMGSSSAFWLAKEAKDVLVIEQFESLHSKGSSHGYSRIIRRTYKESYFSQMMNDAYKYWNEFQSEENERVITKTGGLDFGPPNDPGLLATLQTCKNQNFSYEILNGKEINERFPAFNIPNDYLGIYQEDAGILNPHKMVDLMQKNASKQGVQLNFNDRVEKIKQRGNIIEISTDRATYETKNLIISSGAWINEILSNFNLKVDIKILKLMFAYWEVKNAIKYKINNFPIFIGWDKEIFYGFPIFEKENMIKVAPHFSPDFYSDPSGITKQPNVQLLNKLKNFVQKTFNKIDLLPKDIDTCLYTMTKSEDFIIDFLPKTKNIILLGGFSGHGFKFTPLIGKIARDLIINGHTKTDLTHFRLKNFLLT